jgi:cytidylate kinase
MSVITISRGTFSGGKMLAERLAAKLGYRCIDRDVIVEKAAVPGVGQDVLRDALEKAPSFLDRFKHKKYVYLALIQAALTEEVRTGKAIYHGHAGHLLLKGGTPVLRTRIVAPMEFRLKMAMEGLNLNENGAAAYIQRVDQERQKWTRYLYGVDWQDPSLYDIIINLEFFSLDDACDMLAFVVRNRCPEFTPECQAAMDDLALASRVKASLVLNPATADLEFEVVAQQGHVEIKGKVANLDQFRDLERTVRAVQGVVALNLDAVAPPGPD